MKYYGIICCEFDKSFSLTEVDANFKPTTEYVGISGTCKWCKTKEEQSKMINYIKKLGYKED